ncbi:zinc finger C2HC domain-containing protein 1A-like [Gouania willdenowi]|uniref:zinc finger C2HC domain-containing protein 1A-like n=1 Tax=Gouania willdenowi TaxID=441366 RepID=UPI001054E429|nr:zinc finger C2HC domain-containing protein 1A-like [Gouania willdenowi]
MALPPPPVDLVQCNTCKRRFLPKVWEKHTNICQKVTAKKRKVFDSRRQRLRGTEISVLKPTKPKDKSNNIQCPYCQRRFNESAADRHIKFCKEIHARMPNKGKPGGAKKLAGSTTYRTPAAVKKINTAIVARVPSASTRMPQQSGIRQQSGILYHKASTAGSMRSAGLTSPPSGAANKPQVMSKNHKNLNFTIRAAKTVTAAMKDEKPLPPPPPPTNDPDYIQCPYCQRRFNESAADRHNKIYKEQHAQMPNKGKPGEAKNLAGSTTYKPPAAMKKTNTPMISRIPIAVFRIPQRSSIRQQSGIPYPKASSAGSMRSAGLTSPPSGAANKPQAEIKRN